MRCIQTQYSRQVWLQSCSYVVALRAKLVVMLKHATLLPVKLNNIVFIIFLSFSGSDVSGTIVAVVTVATAAEGVVVAVVSGVSVVNADAVKWNEYLWRRRWSLGLDIVEDPLTSSTSSAYSQSQFLNLS